MMPMTSPGSVSNSNTPSIAATAAMKSGRAAGTVDAPEPARVQGVEAAQRSDVDELDDGSDDHGGEGRLGQVLEQSRQEQQRDDRQHGNHDARHLRTGAGRSVDGRLGQAAVDDHAAGQSAAEVRRPETEQLAIGVDLVVLARRVRLRRAEPLGEPDEHDPGRRSGGSQVVVASHAVGRAERRQAAGDVADDLDALVGEVEELDDDHAEDDGGERTGNDRGEATQPEHERQRRRPDEQRQAVRCLRGG